jgi:hypothetical protein
MAISELLFTIADVTRLRATLGIQVSGWLELSNLLPSLSIGIMSALGAKRSLKALCKTLLGIELEKRRSLTCSDWEAPTLNDEQIAYAAADAFYGLLLFRALAALTNVPIVTATTPRLVKTSSNATVISKTTTTTIIGEEKKVVSSSSSSTLVELPLSSPVKLQRTTSTPIIGLPIALYEWSRWPSSVTAPTSSSMTITLAEACNIDEWHPLQHGHILVSQWQTLLDIPAHKPAHSDHHNHRTSGSGGKSRPPKPQQKMDDSGYIKRKLASVTKGVYENCKMLAPDGTEMAAINNKKVKWYVDRGLATLVSSNPPTIQLKFLVTPDSHCFHLNPAYSQG